MYAHSSSMVISGPMHSAAYLLLSSTLSSSNVGEEDLLYNTWNGQLLVLAFAWTPPLLLLKEACLSMWCFPSCNSLVNTLICTCIIMVQTSIPSLSLHLHPLHLSLCVSSAPHSVRLSSSNLVYPLIPPPLWQHTCILKIFQINCAQA